MILGLSPCPCGPVAPSRLNLVEAVPRPAAPRSVVPVRPGEIIFPVEQELHPGRPVCRKAAEAPGCGRLAARPAGKHQEKRNNGQAPDHIVRQSKESQALFSRRFTGLETGQPGLAAPRVDLPQLREDPGRITKVSERPEGQEALLLVRVSPE